MSGIDPTSSAGGINLMDIASSGGSIQLKFAALQLQMAQSNKEKAMDYMDKITENQEKAKACADMIGKARDLQNKVKEGGAISMPDDMLQFFADNGLSYENTGEDTLHNKEEWDYNIKSLTNYQATVGTDTQQLLLFIQDFMGQYNSYLTGANSAIQQSNQTLGTIARGQ